MLTPLCCLPTPFFPLPALCSSFSLFLFERVGSRNTKTSDQLVVKEAQYFSFRKLWRDLHKATICLAFQKPGYRKPPFR